MMFVMLVIMMPRPTVTMICEKTGRPASGRISNSYELLAINALKAAAMTSARSTGK
jgi:hypothetical protein